MKCNSCGYENGWVPEKLDVVEGEHGEFYRLPIEMKRATVYGFETAEVYACPACGNMQIDI